MASNIPIIGTLYRWWCDHAEKQELIAINSTFEQLLQKPEALGTPLIQKTIELLQHCKDNPSLKSEVAKLERTYFGYLARSRTTLPPAYLSKENRDLVETFSQMGISREFLRLNPGFLSIAKKNFWHQYFPFVKLPIRMVGDELHLPFETEENTRQYQWKSWSQANTLNLDNFRVTFEGFAIGHPDHSKHLVPLKTVEAGDKYALQFVTACPVGRGLPSSINIKASGHSFTQVIVPRETATNSEVYSVGFFPRKFADFGLQFFKTVPGIYRNHDSNVSRIQARQLTPIVKQYVFEEDTARSPCLFSLVKNMDALCDKLKEKNVKFEPITMEQIDKAIFEHDQSELDRILTQLTEIRDQIAEGKLNVPIQPLGRKEKALAVLRRFEEAQGKHSYHLLGSNCTAISFQQEAFAVAFLDAKLDEGKAIKVYDSQIDIRDHEYGIFDRIQEIAERVLLHFFAALPIVGPLLGTGSTHSDAKCLQTEQLLPPIFSQTAFATHQFLTASFTPRPLFPAGEILAKNTPVMEPPGFFARIKYLWNRLVTAEMHT